MEKWRLTKIAIGGLSATLLVAGCRDATAPTSELGDPAQHLIELPEPDHPEEQPTPAEFRLTGGGRVDERDHTGHDKHTPQSRDFATFGFQARPTGPNTTEGSGNITWVDHDPGTFGGGFTFHGRVTYFSTTVDETAGDDDCARFGGTGRAQRRDGVVYEDIAFEVNHGCDKGEPGVGRDHIKITIIDYSRHGLLSGGNIQKHKL